MNNLIDRLEKAKVADRELDCAIYQVLGAKPPMKDRPLYWIAPDGATQHYESIIPDYTASIDAALSLVPEGWSVDLVLHRNNVGNVARVYNDGLHGEPCFIRHTTRPLALLLCVPAIEARATNGH